MYCTYILPQKPPQLQQFLQSPSSTSASLFWGLRIAILELSNSHQNSMKCRFFFWIIILGRVQNSFDCRGAVVRRLMRAPVRITTGCSPQTVFSRRSINSHFLLAFLLNVLFFFLFNLNLSSAFLAKPKSIEFLAEASLSEC